MSTSVLVLAAALAAPHVHLSLRFAPDAGLSPLVVATAGKEAADIWAPHGVAIGSALSEPFDDPEITIIVAVARQTAATPQQRQALGEVRFVNGTPALTIIVFMDEIVRVIERTRLAGTAEWQWPRLMRERVIGRALGRVIAHEIGHIVLQTSRHTPTGLMRATHDGGALIEPGRESFAVTTAAAGKPDSNRR